MRAALLWVLIGVTAAVHAAAPRDIGELRPLATLKLGKHADWVAVDADAVWVASTGPFAVHRIDPGTNQVTDRVELPGEVCAGLALGFGALWVPLCGAKPMLARVDLASRKIAHLYPIGPAAPEGGIAASEDSVWLVLDKKGTLGRVDPASGAVRATVHLPAGSYNPHVADGIVWVTQAEGSSVSAIYARSGQPAFPAIRVGPHPRFLTSGAGAVWTLNQGDGSVTRIDTATRATRNIELHTPGHGGDMGFEGGIVYSTMPKMPLTLIDAAAGAVLCQWAGPGGDSLGLGFGAIWLTDYAGGAVSRISIQDALHHCDPQRSSDRLPLR
jgi:streptogramin lyase